MLWVAFGYLWLALLFFHPSPLTLVLWGWFAVRMAVIHDRKLQRWYLLTQLLGVVVMAVMLWHERSLLDPGPATLLVRIDPFTLSVDGDQLAFDATVVGGRRETIRVFYRLKSAAEQQFFSEQTRVFYAVLRGEVALPDGPAFFGGFNYREFLATKGIFRTLRATKLTWRGLDPTLGAALANLRLRLLAPLESIASPSVRAYVRALLFNQRDELADVMRDRYQLLGVIHLFSISGFHVALLVRLFENGLLRLGAVKEHVQGALLVALLLYGWLIAWPYGMIRASAAYAYRVWCEWRGQLPKPLFGTALSMFLLLLVDPRAAGALGFQLSYGLALLLQWTGQKGQRSGQFQTAFRCTLFSVPFLVAHYHSFSWAPLLFGGLYIAYFSYLLMPMLLLVFSLHITQLSALSGPLVWLTERLIALLEGATALLARLLPLEWVVGRPHWSIVLVLAVALFLYFDYLIAQRKRRRWPYVLLALALLLLRFQQNLSPAGEVALFNVGQGDTIYLETPHQRSAYLIDVCERPTFNKEPWQVRQHQRSVAARVILPSLKAEGARQLDGIFITHADADHMGALKEVMANVSVKHLYLSIGMQQSPTALRTLKQALLTSKNRAVAVHWLKTGDTVTLKHGPTLTVLSPDAPGDGSNATSLVLYGAIGGAHWLFTGDLEGENEQKVAKRIAQNHLTIDNLKVAHHGSKNSTSDALIDAWRPQRAFISVGKNNRYGHPALRVIESLEQNGATVYRTDQQGAVYAYYSHGRQHVETVQ